MTQILKLSYDQLDSSLKSCFAYCAIFPKDFEINKQILITLWMAQGYISAENVGNEYFHMLLQRCFFQNVTHDKWGEVEWFKIHDIAEQVVGDKICRFSSDNLNVSKRVQHLSLLYSSYTEKLFVKTHIRTFLQINEPWRMASMDQLLAGKLIANWTCLRSLDLSRFGAKYLPKSIGKLVHLRCLNLSWCRVLEELPKSITKLVNLQTLDLSGCTSLKELPKDVSKLVDLNILNVTSCNELSRMPSNMRMLTHLHTLGQFVAGGRASSRSNSCFDGLEDLQSLNNLRGSLRIRIGVLKNARFVKEDHGGGSYLRSKELRRISIKFERGEEYGSKQSEHALLEEMQPHHGVVELQLISYNGETLPRWPRREDQSSLFYLPNLVTLVIWQCSELLYLPFQVGKLPNLRNLRLWLLPNMEYMVNVDQEASGSGKGSSFFPCLEELRIGDLPKLIGWWPRSGCPLRERFPCFAQLKRLRKIDCPMLTSVPMCSRLEAMCVIDSGQSLEWRNMMQFPRDYQSLLPLHLKPKILAISHLEHLKSLPTEYFQILVAIVIHDEAKVVSLEEAPELFHTTILSLLRFVRIETCPKLTSCGRWLEHLTALHSLYIGNCPKLVDNIPWQHLSQSLRCLNLERLVEMEELPEGIQHCTSLRSVIIKDTPRLSFLPNWISKLTSIRKLQLRYCSKRLKERCQPPNGDDWPLIQHIPFVSILDNEDDDPKLQMFDEGHWIYDEDWR